ncbi:c-type cytochrome [Pseudoduganella sp. R-34]|uniref:c-type cytochrome n=1 Tax=unclassified Pseudoduganella TaxID=2637179 RepID=UPI003CF9B5ED
MKFSHAFGALALLASTTFAMAAPHAITLPPETAKLKPSALPGYQIALQKCATCHSADYMEYQAPHMTLAQWTKEAAKMRDLFGAPLSEDDVRQVGAYLAVTYGSAKESELPAALRSAAPVRPGTPDAGAGNAKAPDVKALLAANACLSCHAIDAKVVGPAYKDIARKYRGDASALDKASASIQGGSAGKWGPVAMPPFGQLKPEEARALAAFVLKQ